MRVGARQRGSNGGAVRHHYNYWPVGSCPGRSCDQGDKVWTIGANNLNDNVQVLFSSPIENIHVMQMVGFDTSDAAGNWSIDYTITVTDPNFFIDAMFAGADNPGGLDRCLRRTLRAMKFSA